MWYHMWQTVHMYITTLSSEWECVCMCLHMCVGLCVCVCVAGGLSDEISVSGSVQDDLGKLHYKGVRFRARGISKAAHVLAVYAFYCFYISLCETWERTSLLYHGENIRIYGFITPGFECVTLLFLWCVHFRGILPLFFHLLMHLCGHFEK